MEINLCMGSSCFARGNQKNLMVIKQLLNEYNLNNTVKVTGTLCEGACGSGPCIRVDDRKFNEVKPEQIRDILIAIFKEKNII